MAIYDFIPSPDLDYKGWITRFAELCEINEKELGLSPEQILLIQEQSAEFESLCDLTFEKKQELQGIIASKDQARRTSTETARAIAKQVKANPAITPELLGALGIVQTRTSGPLVPVKKLVVTGTSNGVNSLTWDRNGNAQGTVFLIEYKLEDSTEWNFVAAVTKATFQDTDQIPGHTNYYRVKASRSGKTSIPCAPAVIYSQTSESKNTIAA